jgi:hypothetical protein
MSGGPRLATLEAREIDPQDPRTADYVEGRFG